MVYNCINNIQSILFPFRCLLCGAKGAREMDLCPDCRNSLPHNHQPCALCAEPLSPGAPASSLCGQCIKNPPVFGKVYAPLLYQPPVDHLIQRLKFGYKLAAGRLLGQLLADHLLANQYERPELLLPVPLDNKQLGIRGFNQSAELAAHLSRKLQIPWNSRLLRKTRPTREQSGLNKKDRKANLRSCFAFDNRAEYQHVAIVDDVLTTGTTAEEISKLLLKKGVTRVDVLAVARTPPFS